MSMSVSPIVKSVLQVHFRWVCLQRKISVIPSTAALVIKAMNELEDDDAQDNNTASNPVIM